MKKLSIILNNIKNLLPYFLLIAIYFFFVNLEARKDKSKNQKEIKERILHQEKSSFEDKNLKITIPVIPYNK